MPSPTDSHDSYSGPLREIRSISTVGTGNAITTTNSFILLPLGFNWISLTPRNLSTANMVQVSFCPWLAVIKTVDNLGTFTDYSNAANDSDTTTVVTLSSLSTAAAQDYLLIGADQPFAGVSIDVTASTNSTVSTLTVKYWNGTSWVDISATDNTNSGGASLAIDGTVTWTVPTPVTTWVKAPLSITTSPAPTAIGDLMATALYWTRWEFSAGLDASVTLASIAAISRQTGAELLSGQTLESRVYRGLGGLGCLQAVVDSGVGGTANLVVNVGIRPPLVGIGLP